MELDTFIVALGQQKFTVTKQLADVCLYFHNILSLGMDEEEIQIDPSIIDRPTFLLFLRFWELNQYKEPVVPKGIKTNNVKQVLDKNNYEFIKEYELQSQQLRKLISAASFLVCRGLKQVIAAVYACKIYFEDTKRAYEEKKKELGIPENTDITFQDEQKFREEYYMTSSIVEP